jgi:hypothetical protein
MSATVWACILLSKFLFYFSLIITLFQVSTMGTQVLQLNVRGLSTIEKIKTLMSTVEGPPHVHF